MDIIELNNCGYNNALFAVTLPQAVDASALKTLAHGRVIVQNPAFSPPHFKIVDKLFTMRGAVGQNRMSIQFNSADKQMCRQIIEKIINGD